MSQAFNKYWLNEGQLSENSKVFLFYVLDQWFPIPSQSSRPGFPVNSEISWKKQDQCLSHQHKYTYSLIQQRIVPHTFCLPYPGPPALGIGRRRADFMLNLSGRREPVINSLLLSLLLTCSNCIYVLFVVQCFDKRTQVEASY